MPDSEKRLSRRQLFKAAVAVGGLALAQEVKTIPEKMDIPKIVDQEIDGYQYRFIFWQHGNDKNIPASDLHEEYFPHNLTHAEAGLFPYLEFPTGVVVPMEALLGVSQRTDDLFQHTLLKNKPVVFSDLPINSLAILENNASSALEMAAGGVGIKLAADKLTQKPDRRIFLGLTVGASLLGVLHGALVTSSQLLPILDRFVNLGPNLDSTVKDLESLKPYNLIFRVRNLVAAIKILDAREDTNILFGLQHLALPAYMESGKKQLFAELQQIHLLFEPLKAALPSKEYLYTSLLMIPKTREDGTPAVGLERVVHDDLKKLFE